MKNEKRSSQIIIEENQKLKSAIAELSILNKIATAIASTQSLEQIIKLVVQKCVKHLHVEQGAVMLIDSNEEFGEKKLLENISVILKCTADGIVQRILCKVKEHSKKVEQSDDITIMIIKRVE